MKSTLLVLFTLALCILGSNSTTPGVKIAFSPTALTDFINYYLPTILKAQETIKIPDVNDGNLKISNIVLQKIYLPGSSVKVSLTKDHGVFSTDNFGFSLDFHVNDKVLGFIPVSLQLGGASNNSKLSFDLSFGFKDPSVQVKINKLSLNIQNMDIHFPSGVLDDIVKEMTKILQKPLQDIISFTIADVLKGLIESKINDGLTKIPGFGPIPSTQLAVDYQATQAPTVNDGYLAGYLNGTFYLQGKNFSVPPITQRVDYPEFDKNVDSNIQAYVSEYTINSIINALWEADLMNVNITNSMIPPEAGLKFTVGWLQQFIPNITAYYNDTNTDLITAVTAKKAPVLTLSENDVKVQTTLTLSFYSNDTNNIKEVVVVEAPLELHFNFTLDNYNVKPFASGALFGDFSIARSQVGDFDASLFTQGLNILFMFALPGFNEKKVSFALPSLPGMDLSSLQTLIHDGYISVAVHPVYPSIAKAVEFFVQRGVSHEELSAAILEEKGFLGF